VGNTLTFDNDAADFENPKRLAPKDIYLQILFGLGILFSGRNIFSFAQSWATIFMGINIILDICI